MTSIFVRSANCKCEPANLDNKKFVLVEGHTDVWVCIHTDYYFLKHKKEWEMQ